MASATALWVDAGAYRHCFLIAPIAVYLIYCGRDRLEGLAPKPSLWGAAICAVSSVVWLASYEAGVAEGEHFALVAIIEGLFLASFGWTVFKRMIIPLLYLFLMVPTGEFLLPVLQKITAVASGYLLELSTIPTYREGVLIEVPSGSYVVAPGCAGLNFLLASVALAIAYVDLVYRDWWRRAAFVAAMVGLALAGNAVRVYLIILVAHLTDNVGNIAEDHLLYGWGFFTVLILAAMAIGQRYGQDPGEGAATPGTSWQKAPSSWLTVGGAVSALVALSLAPGLVLAFSPSSAPVTAQAARLSCGPFPQTGADTRWIGQPGRVDAMGAADCVVGGTRVHVVLATLQRPMRQGKLFGLEQWLTGSDAWTLVGHTAISVDRPDGKLSGLAQRFDMNGMPRTMWSVRWVDGVNRRPGFDTLLGDFLAQLRGHRRVALLLVMADGVADETTPALRRLVAAMPLPPADLGENTVR